MARTCFLTFSTFCNGNRGSWVSAGSTRPTRVAGLPGELMYGIHVEQDINCRTVGRCTYGAPLDREVLDLIPREVDGEAAQNEMISSSATKCR